MPQRSRHRRLVSPQVAERREQHRPTLIAVHSQIAYGAPQQGKCCAHGAPLGEAEAGHGTWRIIPVDVSG